MSKRRRQYEPEGVGVTFNMLNPCADMDLAVVGRTSGTLALIVDYKLEGAHIDPRHKTHQAMGSIRTGGVTILLVEQNAERAFSVADRVHVMSGGVFALSGTPEALHRDPHFDAAYFGVGMA